MKKTRIIGAFLLVFMLIAMLAACKNEENALTEDGNSEILESALGFSVEFPSSWQGKWATVAAEEDSMEIYHIAVREQYGKGTGRLFSIRRTDGPIDGHIDINDYPTPIVSLGEYNGYKYYFLEPSDVQYPIWDGGDPELANEYANMVDDFPAIRESIKFGAFTPSGPVDTIE